MSTEIPNLESGRPSTDGPENTKSGFVKKAAALLLRGSVADSHPRSIFWILIAAGLALAAWMYWEMFADIWANRQLLFISWPVTDRRI